MKSGLILITGCRGWLVPLEKRLPRNDIRYAHTYAEERMRRDERGNNVILFTWRVYFHPSAPLAFVRGRRWIFITHLFYPRYRAMREGEATFTRWTSGRVARTRTRVQKYDVTTADVRSRRNRTAALLGAEIAEEKIRSRVLGSATLAKLREYTWRRITAAQLQKHMKYINRTTFLGVSVMPLQPPWQPLVKCEAKSL